MARTAVGNLIQSGRERVSPPLTQGELASLVGSEQRTISNIESGRTKSVSPALANQLVRVLPITMTELVQALGYDLPAVARVGVPQDILQGLSGAPEELLHAVRLAIAGQRAVLATQARSGRERSRPSDE